MTRLDAARRLSARLRDEPVVASLGHPAYDLYAAGDRPRNFYTWGSMGLASSIGAGLALARPDLRIVVTDGDGSLLMNLGSLATIGWLRLSNLVLVVWDNGEYGTTGGQASATASAVDLAAVGRAASFPSSVTVRDPDALDAALSAALSTHGPHLIVAKVRESAPFAKPPLDGVWIKQRFMDALGTPVPNTQGTSA